MSVQGGSKKHASGCAHFTDCPNYTTHKEEVIKMGLQSIKELKQGSKRAEERVLELFNVDVDGMTDDDEREVHYQKVKMATAKRDRAKVSTAVQRNKLCRCPDPNEWHYAVCTKGGVYECCGAQIHTSGLCHECR